MRFPGPPNRLPTRDEMADYLESYAAHFELPIMHGVRVERLSREGDRYLLQAGDQEFEAEHVIVAMSSYQGAKVPSFARELSPEIVQLHSSEYKNLAQLKPGGVLLVGAGNSGAEIAVETATTHATWLSGRDTGELPFPSEQSWIRYFLLGIVLRVVFHRVLTVDTPAGRRVRETSFHSGGPRIRQRRVDLERAGVQWVARMAGAREGLPLLEDGRTLEVRNVIWCTGFDNGLSWIDLRVFEPDGEPRNKSGLVEGEPGLYLVGHHFQHAFSSTMIHGAGRDAARVVAAINARLAKRRVAPPHGTPVPATPYGTEADERAAVAR
jgi:putative flavoprotein involved in K+ transport